MVVIRTRFMQGVAVTAAVAVAITIAAVSPGFEAREITPENPSVWVTRASGQYARVNTATAEIDTVRQIESPSAVVQSSELGLLLSDGNGRVSVIDPAYPLDILRDPAEAGGTLDRAPPSTTSAGAAPAPETHAPVATPQGTRIVTAAGGFVAYLTDTGAVFISAVDTGAGQRLSSPQQVDAFDGRPTSAVAVDDAGTTVLFSAQTGQWRSYDAHTGAFTSRGRTVPGWHNTKPTTPLQLSLMSGGWVLFDSDHSQLWRDAQQPVTLTVQGRGLLQQSTTAQPPPTEVSRESPGRSTHTVLLADEAGLWQVADHTAERIFTGSGSGSGSSPSSSSSTGPGSAGFVGIPTAPTIVTAQLESAAQSVAVAAWMSTDGAKLWDKAAGLRSLELDPSLDELVDPLPALLSNGTGAVLADQRSGMLWSVPQGTLIPLSQWVQGDPPENHSADTSTQLATEPEPPVAIDDSFGVRAGAPNTLPVLLNDYDPNTGDVLTIVTDGLGHDLDPHFGTVTALANAQEFSVTTEPNAAGTTRFTYSVTDGVHVSAPASVSITIAPEEDNSAPVWCGVSGCTRSVPAPQLAPGGTLVLPLLEGWVDPQADPLRVLSARLVDPAAPARTLVTADGSLAVQHTDPNAAAHDIEVIITISDSRGSETEQTLTVAVRAGATPRISNTAHTVRVGDSVTFDPLSSVSGGSGSYELLDIVTEFGSAQPTLQRATQAATLRATEPGESRLTVTIRDRGTAAETTGAIRLTAVAEHPPVALPELRAYVQPYADTSIDVLTVLPDASDRGLVVREANVTRGALRADTLEHAIVHVTSTGAAGTENAQLGSIALALEAADGTHLTGRISVYRAMESNVTGVITRPDTVTVRAGALADIDVLSNDLVAPGEWLVLHPEIITGQDPGGLGGDVSAIERDSLAFASGSQLRYLAPSEPGEYRLTYSAYAAGNPHTLDTATVHVRVIGDTHNSDPQPVVLTVRVAPGEHASVAVPLTGVDPDGDRVRLIGADAGATTGLSVAPDAAGDTLTVSAAQNTPAGIQLVNYTVRDIPGADGIGVLRVIVTGFTGELGAPIPFADDIRLPVDAEAVATLRPTENDRDPAHGTLEILSVTPDLPGGSAHPEYATLEARLDLTDLQAGVVRIRGSDTPGVHQFTYTVRSAASTGTADATITVHDSGRLGAVAPRIRDTVLTAGQRHELADTGIDVLTGQVTWNGGDPSTLTLEVWGAAATDFHAVGHRIVGAYPETGTRVPFRVKGIDAEHAPVYTYGFLFLPPLDELRITLDPGLTPLAVEEGHTASVSTHELLALSGGDRVELASEPFRVHRSQASCTGSTSEAGASLSYSAGRDAPWSDTCALRVKLTEQTTYSTVNVPIAVIPAAPVVQLSPLIRTIAAGSTHTIELTDMRSWLGNRAGKSDALQWQLDTAAATGFDIAQSGTQLTVTAHATARPGSQHTLTVRVHGAGEAAAPLTLRVGQAAADIPRGATIALRCTVGAECSTSLVGQPGEYDPFAGAPQNGLTVTSIDDSGCQLARLTLSENQVRANWPDALGPGGRCTVRFTVADAQQRTGNGTLEFDAQGVPSAPESITQLGYTAKTVELLVKSGAAAQAHPALTAIVIDQDGQRSNAECRTAGAGARCLVTGLEPGVEHRFTARAVNQVGESAPTAAAVTAWAYRTPAAPTVRVTQRTAESEHTATLEFHIDTADRTTGGFRVTAGSHSQNIALTDRATLTGVPVGETSWEVVPISTYTPPPGDTADGATASGALTVAGIPTLTLHLSSEAGSAEVTAHVEGNPNGGSALRLGIASAIGTDVPTCTTTVTGTHHSVTLSGSLNRTLHVVACAETEWGSAAPLTQRILVGGEVPQPTVQRGFEIGLTPTVTADGDYVYGVVRMPEVIAAADATIEYQVNGVSVGASFPETLDPENRTTVRVRQIGAESTSEWAVVPGNLPAPVRITLPACLNTDASPVALAQLVSTAARSDALLSYLSGTLTVQWRGDFAALTPLAVSVPSCTDLPP